MANLQESDVWDDGIYQLETTDNVVGGPDGVSNRQAKALANRTKYLLSLFSGKQPLDATLTALAALTVAADKLIYATGPDTFATTALTSFIRTLLDDADATSARATLGAAPLASPVFTGIPAAPTPAAGTNTTQVATTAFVQAAVATLVNSSPAALDTLAELATALGNDASFATTMTNALASKQPLDATLTALATLTVAADKLIYATGPDTFATTELTSFIRTLLDDVDAESARTTLSAARKRIRYQDVDVSTGALSYYLDGLPSWARKITICFNKVSLSSSSNLLVKLRQSFVSLSSGYESGSAGIVSGGSPGLSTSTVGFNIRTAYAAESNSGVMRISSNNSATIFTEDHATSSSASGSVYMHTGGGTVTVAAGSVTGIEITSVSGTDTFDSGSFWIEVEE